MINIKDKLKVSNILIKRTNDVDVEYVPAEVFEADIKDINKRINEIDGADIDADNYVSKAEFNNEIDAINQQLSTIKEKKVDATGINFANSAFEELSDAFDFSNVTNFTRLFENCYNLKKVNANLTGSIAASNSKEEMFMDCTALETGVSFYALRTNNMTRMYKNCKSLKTCPGYEILECVSTSDMFNGCYNLETVGNFSVYEGAFLDNVSYMFNTCSSLIKAPTLPTKKVTNFEYMFCGCSSLVTIPEYDASNASKISGFFYNCGDTLVNFGGLNNLKIDWNDYNGLINCPNLTYESVMNVINGLYDFRGNGDMTTTRTLKLHWKLYNLLSDDDKAIATSKGWILS